MNTPSEINAIQVGMKVQHAKFGMGKVLTIEGSGKDRKAVVFFENIGQKTLLLAFAKLVIVG
jgi:DNA helicase-2/ATP-dependent DNA helicase PcrA